ncbi:uncharacterized protein K460DRAFT_269872, partial [Cucurbitaria berberidis CBS 394.84]
AIKQKRELRKAGLELRAAKKKFKDQVAAQARRECRPLCEKMHAKLPQELRDIICESIISDHNATFFHGENHETTVANGTSPLQHCFEPAYTGKGMHKDMVVSLGRLGSRFDFRGHHELLGTVFEQYLVEFGLDLATTIKRIGLLVTERDLKTRETMFERLENLFKLSPGTAMYIFIETGDKTLPQVKRQFRRVLRVLFPLLHRLKDAGYLIKIVMNPPYLSSAVKNSNASTFSVVPEAPYRYEITPDNAQFTAAGFEDKLEKVRRLLATLYLSGSDLYSALKSMD